MTTTFTPKSHFLGKAAVKREQRGVCSGTAERKQAHRGFLGNGLRGRVRSHGFLNRLRWRLHGCLLVHPSFAGYYKVGL